MDFCTSYFEQRREALDPGAARSIDWKLAMSTFAQLIGDLDSSHLDFQTLTNTLLMFSQTASLSRPTRVFGFTCLLQELNTICNEEPLRYSISELIELFAATTTIVKELKNVKSAPLKQTFQTELHTAFVELFKLTWNKPSLVQLVESVNSQAQLNHLVLKLHRTVITRMSNWPNEAIEKKQHVLKQLKTRANQAKEARSKGVHEIIAQIETEIGQYYEEVDRNRSRGCLNSLKYMKFVQEGQILSAVTRTTSKSPRRARAFYCVVIEMLDRDIENFDRLNGKDINMWSKLAQLAPELLYLQHDEHNQLSQRVNILYERQRQRQGQRQGQKKKQAPPTVIKVEKPTVNLAIEDYKLIVRLADRILEVITPYAITRSLRDKILNDLDQIKSLLAENQLHVKTQFCGSARNAASFKSNALNLDLTPVSSQTTLADIAKCLEANGFAVASFTKQDQSFLSLRSLCSKLEFHISLNFVDARVFGNCLRELFRRSKEFAQLLLFLKYWAFKTQSLDGNGHHLTLLVIHFLQLHKFMPELDSLIALGGPGHQHDSQVFIPNVTYLAMDFFEYFAEFQPNVCINLRTKELVPGDYPGFCAVFDPMTSSVLAYSDETVYEQFRSGLKQIESLEMFETHLG